MKIRVFLDKKNFVEVKCINFTFVNNEFWYLDDKYTSHTLKNVYCIASY